MKVLVKFNNPVITDMENLDLIAKMVLVNQDGYGKEATYIPTENTPEIEIIKDSQFKVKEEDTIAELKRRLEKTEQEKSNHWRQMYNAQQENEKLKKELETAKGLFPHNEPAPELSKEG